MMDRLINDLILSIMVMLDLKSLLKLSRVCTRFRRICLTSMALWRLKYRAVYLAFPKGSMGVEDVMNMTILRFRCVDLMIELLTNPFGFTGAMMLSIFPTTDYSRYFDQRLELMKESLGITSVEIAKGLSPFPIESFASDDSAWDSIIPWNRLIIRILAHLDIKNLNELEANELHIAPRFTHPKNSITLYSCMQIDAIRIIYKHLKDKLGAITRCDGYWRSMGIYYDETDREILELSQGRHVTSVSMERYLKRKRAKEMDVENEESRFRLKRAKPEFERVIACAVLGYGIDTAELYYRAMTRFHTKRDRKKFSRIVLTPFEGEGDLTISASGKVVITADTPNRVEKLWSALLKELERIGMVNAQ